MTNYEKIKTMSVEEMAAYIFALRIKAGIMSRIYIIFITPAEKNAKSSETYTITPNWWRQNK